MAGNRNGNRKFRVVKTTSRIRAAAQSMTINSNAVTWLDYTVTWPIVRTHPDSTKAMNAVRSISVGWPRLSYSASTKWKKLLLRRLLGGCFSKWARPTVTLPYTRTVTLQRQRHVNIPRQLSQVVRGNGTRSLNVFDTPLSLNRNSHAYLGHIREITAKY